MNFNEEMTLTKYPLEFDKVWPFLTILTEGIQLDSFDESRYEEICQHIRYVITTAYDGEGYLVWERTSNELPMTDIQSLRTEA